MRRVKYLGWFLLLALEVFGQSAAVLARRAQDDLRARRNSQAEQELLLALKSEPANWNLWYDLGLARLELGENGPAIEALEKARRLAPHEASPNFGLGLLYMKTGDVEQALKAYGDGLARDPQDEPANQNYALLLIQKGDFRRAIEPLRRIKSRGHDDLATRAALIRAYLKSGMKNEAGEEINHLFEARLASMQQELSLAALCAADGEIGAAAKILQHSAITWPEAAEPHGELGLVSMLGGQYETAVGELGRAAQLDPNSAKYALGLGEALLRWRHDPVALQYLLAVREKFGELPHYQFELALAYFYLTRYPLALEGFESLAQEQPKSSRVQSLLGATYQAMGNLEKAEECYRKAIALKPDEASYYVTLASLLKKVAPSDLAEPIRLVQKALTLDAKDVQARLLLAACNEAQGKLTEAQALLETLVTSDPDLRTAHVALAKVYFRQKRLEDAQQQELIAAKLESEKQDRVSPWGPGENGAH